MKKTLLIIGLCLAGLTGIQAQVVQENELALVYYMPQTLMDIDITYTIETEEAGPYSRYAEKYLGTEDVISVNNQKAEIMSVSVRAHSRADMSRPFKVSGDGGTHMQLLNIAENGVLYGYNTGIRKAEAAPAKPCRQQAEKAQQPETLPLTEEQLKATTPALRAEAIAKQI